jgi:hypothetical protein
MMFMDFSFVMDVFMELQRLFLDPACILNQFIVDHV